MTILYLTNHLNIGGVTSYLFSLSSGMKKRGHNVYVASFGGDSLPKFTKEEVVHLPLPLNTKSEISPKVLISFFKLLPFIKEKQIDIIHANTRVTQVLGCLAARFSGKPLVSTCHGFFKKRFSRKIFPCWGRKIIAISQEVKEHLIEDFGIAPEKIEVINNGVDIEKFQSSGAMDPASIKNKLGLKSGPVIGIVARLSDVKGHIYLIEAFKKVLADIADAQLLITGDGKIKEELAFLVKRLGIEKQVYFIPSVIDTREVLSVMDIFVMPSLAEGLGLGLMEAMAKGVAVIGSDVGGIKSLIKDNFNGLLASPRDIDGLRKAILELLNDSTKRDAFVENAKIFISQNFSLEQMVLKTERFYQGCLNES